MFEISTYFYSIFKKQDQLVDYVRDFCSGISGTNERALCLQYADNTVRYTEQMLPTNSPSEICHAKCPACSGKRNNDKKDKSGESYACDTCVVATTALKLLIERNNFTHVSFNFKK